MVLLFYEPGLFCFDFSILCNSEAEGDFSLAGKIAAVDAVSAGGSRRVVRHDDNVGTARNAAGLIGGPTEELPSAAVNRFCR